jgi:hypothetical protein
MRRLLIPIVLLACACAAPVASAAGQTGPVADCYAHQQLTHRYSTAQLRRALNTMPADIKEYTDCFDVIQRQLLAQLGHAKPGAAASKSSSSGGSFLPTPVIVVLVVLILVAAGFGAVALRRRRDAGGGGDNA